MFFVICMQYTWYDACPALPSPSLEYFFKGVDTMLNLAAKTGFIEKNINNDDVFIKTLLN